MHTYVLNYVAGGAATQTKIAGGAATIVVVEWTLILKSSLGTRMAQGREEVQVLTGLAKYTPSDSLCPCKV